MTTNDNNQPKLYADLNISEKIGRLTADPIIKGEAGDQYATFAIAVNKQYMTKDGEIKELVNFFNLIVSSNLDRSFEVVTRLKKGDRVRVKGEDRTYTYETDEGVRKFSHQIRAYNIELLTAHPQTEMTEEAAAEAAVEAIEEVSKAWVDRVDEI